MIYLQYSQVCYIQEGGCINIKTIRVDQWSNPWPWKSVYDYRDQGIVSESVLVVVPWSHIFNELRG